jgi:hypothetical protein
VRELVTSFEWDARVVLLRTAMEKQAS